jgi:4-diphosphocytidyl-2-C-methyl-D-erythritol kinase
VEADAGATQVLMTRGARRARLRAFAKINLSLLVTGTRADGYHELRTVFQTISLADALEVEFRPARRTQIAVESSVDVGDNLAARAARLLSERLGLRGEVRIRVEKRIPVGSGLGGGSSDAAAVLLALPALARRPAAWEALVELGEALGSDVPFFLHGGTAMGQGRGEELYPLPSLKAAHVLVVAPPARVSTEEAYGRLDRSREGKLTFGNRSNRMKKFQSLVAALVCPSAYPGWQTFCENDFEGVVFRQHPFLQSLQQKLLRLGAEPARLSGSGSALFGVFGSSAALERGYSALRREETMVEKVRLVSRERYRAAWFRALSPYVDGERWPPQGR